MEEHCKKAATVHAQTIANDMNKWHQQAKVVVGTKRHHTTAIGDMQHNATMIENIQQHVATIGNTQQLAMTA